MFIVDVGLEFLRGPPGAKGETGSPGSTGNHLDRIVTFTFNV